MQTRASWGTFRGPVGETAISWWEGRGLGRIGGEGASLSESVFIHLRERCPPPAWWGREEPGPGLTLL